MTIISKLAYRQIVRPYIKWAVSLVIALMIVTLIFLEIALVTVTLIFLEIFWWVCMGLTYSLYHPRGLKP